MSIPKIEYERCVIMYYPLLFWRLSLIACLKDVTWIVLKMIVKVDNKQLIKWLVSTMWCPKSMFMGKYHCIIIWRKMRNACGKFLVVNFFCLIK
jgi:hypothetical protein